MKERTATSYLAKPNIGKRKVMHISIQESFKKEIDDILKVKRVSLNSFVVSSLKYFIDAIK